MVTFSGQNNTIPNQGPKSKAHFERGFFNSSVWQSMAAIQTPFKDPNHLALQELGQQFHSGLFQGNSQRLYSLSISFQGSKYFNTAWTTQLVHTGDNSINLYVLGPIRPIKSSTVGIQSHSSISRWTEMYWPIFGPIQTIQPVIHLPGSVFQFFTYTGHLSAPGDFFPS
ncbi:hypothetical protein O181_056056 [Austropuccinia psidii MF-1]|uniref:Uncharacterized protein n=1 Tax=Austropuccinia psidii MF-1 TaxID=1389203 RepID=A0A9Q3HSL2_9BASI|nr:hypothetical protein [Austropuccinia psidii MF-1]